MLMGVHLHLLFTLMWLLSDCNSVLSDLCGGCELETGGDVANTVSFTLLAIKYVNNLVIYTNTNTVGMNAFLKLPIVIAFRPYCTAVSG